MGTEGGRVQDGGSGASWVFSSMAKVNSGFQSVVDSVWHWGRAPYFFPMDTLHTLLFGWLIFGVLVVLLAKFLYDKFLSGDNDIDEYSQNNFDDQNAPKLPTGGCLGPPPKISRKATIVPDGPPERVSPPVATGGDPDAIRWINNLLVWFYEGSEGGPILKDAWNDVLNEYTVGVALETGVLVEVLEFLPQSPPPQLTNIVVDCSPTDDMTITCDVEQILYLRVQTTRTQRDVTTESEYACAVRPLRGRLNIAVQTHKCRAHAKLDGWPDVTIILEGVRNNATGLDEQQLQDVLTEVLSSAIRMVCLDIDFTQKRTFPRFSRVRSVPDRVMPVGYDALNRSTSSATPVGIVGLNGKRLLVKVVKASGIGGDKDVSLSYAVIEMDEPPQKFTTASVSDTSSPFWDEQFLFDLSDNTLELLFEIYDKKDKRFLGLGIVGIEELVATPSQRQIIPLQSRPCENDKVSGSLTCEFLFLDRADLPDLTFRAASGSNQGSNRFKVSSTSHDKPNEGEYYDEGITLSKESDPVSWKEVEGRHTKPVPSTKSTMVVHSSREETVRKVIKVARAPSGEYTELNGLSQPMNDERPEIPSGDSLEEEEMWVPSLIAPVVPQLTTSGATGYTSSSDHSAATGKTSTASNVEDKSLLTTNDTDEDTPKNMPHSDSQRLLTVPTGMRKSSTGNFGGDSGSTRSSLSGTSGLSSASTRTFINEASLLVVETLENGIIKHYLVPLALQRKNKWRKKGTKLHIYNEHTFVAKHLSSSVLCHVCNKTLGRRLGKQGYECRDCSFKCHKPCHIKTDIVCPNSTVNSMDLVYVKDEKAERKKALRIS